ncbi:DNA internalization-related competence protein ComEC/Rec2 [Desulfurivibrio sp. D14AmB]|uniref:DNA internalization-related competence protein ComEC/Rec2 n=1 Tax=Desulfurivibrio sp. D14AmB TaxID=3374370 RepID=UPI00376EF026
MAAARRPEPRVFPGLFIPVTLALMAGIVAARYFAVPPLLTLPVAPAAALATYWLLRRPAAPPTPILLFLLLLILFLGAGYHLARPHLAPPTDPNHLYNLLPTDRQSVSEADHDVVLVGVLRQLPRPAGGRTRLVLAVEELRRPKGSQPAHGLIQITINGSLSADIRPGELLLLRARVGPVRSFRVPGAFDYHQFLAHQGIRLSGWVANPLQVARLEPIQPPTPAFRLRHFPERLRHAANGHLEQHLADHQALPLLKALLIGDRSGIPPATLETFKAAGAMHLLAISGMHLGLIAMMSMAASEWLLKRSPRLLLTLQVRKVALLLALLPIIGYALITGLNPPAQRALLMTLVFMGAILLDRQWCSLNNLAIAALLILALDPPALFGASFQLSFAATAGIIMLLPSLQNNYREIGGPASKPRERSPAILIGRKILFWIGASLLVSTVATLVTTPLALHHFHRVSLLSPLTTLLATPPLFFLTLPSALAGLALTALNLPGGGPLLLLSAWGVEFTTAITSRLAALPFSFYYLSPPSPAEWGAWLGLFGALPLYRRHRFWAAATGFTMLLLLLLLPALEQWRRWQSPNSRVTFIEVGHGQATVVELPGNRTVLVDGGGPATLSTDIGEQLIAPFLRQRRIRRLTAVVISHPHADHYNGFPFLLRYFHPQTLWINGQPGVSSDYQALLQTATELGIEIVVPSGGEELVGRELKEGGAARLYNLADFHRREAAGDLPPKDPVNDQSLVIGYQHDDFWFILPGDIGTNQERRLLPELKATTQAPVLAASHHGRRTSMAPEFIAAVAPGYIVVSDDERRTDYRRVAKWQTMGADVFTTGRDGSITCTVAGGELTCQPAIRRR